MVISSLGPCRRGEHVGARHTAAESHGPAGFAPVSGQEQSALDECFGSHLRVEAKTEHIAPGLRQDPPFPIAALTVDVAEPIDHRPGIGVGSYGIEAPVTMALQEPANLFDGRAHLSRVIAAAILMPAIEDDLGGSRNCASLPR